jgi:primosomal protein N' (replication factor Y)
VYTYGVPLEYQADIQVGMRVEVQFGKRKIYSAIVKNVHNNKPEVYVVKPIRNILDTEPLVTPEQLKHWQWMSNYYMSPEGDVMNAALPTHLKLVSESYISLNDDIEIDTTKLTDDEYLVVEALQIQKEKTKTIDITTI